MQDNIPSHASRSTREFLEGIGFSGNKLMTWPASLPDLNPIQNLWSQVRHQLNHGGKQYTSKTELWNAIGRVVKVIPSETIKNLTDSMDERLLKVVSRNGEYIHM